MGKPRSETLTPREAQIMEVLWDRGSATAEAIREAMPDRLHDSTVRTLLRVLERKGHVTHREEGRVFVYEPAVERARVQRKALSTFLHRFFSGSAEALVLRLLEDEHLSKDALDELKGRASRSTKRPRRKRPK